MRASTEFTLSLALVAGTCAAIGASFAMMQSAYSHRYDLVAALRGDAYILDTRLTFDDCKASLADERSHWGTAVAFRCKVER